MLFLPRGSELGQGLVEYGLIMVLISIVAVAALMFIADSAGSEFERVGNVLNTNMNP